MSLTSAAADAGQAGADRAPDAKGGHWAWLLAWLAFLPVAVLRAGTLSEADTFWQIRTGLVTISHQAIPRTDPFSWTMRGKPWTLNSWGFNVLLGLAYRVVGLTGVAWACAGLVMVAAGLVILAARRLGATPVITVALLLLASPLLFVWLSARPQLIDYIAVPTLVLLLRRIACGVGGAREVAAAAALSVAWVNLHAGSLLGVAVAVACAVPLLARRATRARGWLCLATAAVMLAGSFVYPYGIGVLSQTQHVRAASAGLVAEWQPFDPASPSQWLALAVGLGGLVLAARRQEWAFAGALAVLAAATIYASRFQPMLLLVALPVLGTVAPQAPPPVPRSIRSRRVMFYRCTVAGLVAWAAVVAAPSLAHVGRPDPAIYPVGIVRDIPHGCHLFNSYLLGSFVILERPDVLVSLDSRNDLYGRQRILADERTLNGQGDLGRELAGAGCVLIPPSLGLAANLHHDPAWTLRASAPAAVLFVRRQG